jgi:RNA recognition motif-containing protein
MATRVYVGNLSPTTTDDMLREAFSGYGNVVDAIVMRDRYTDRSRGFGFVTYSSHSEAEAAVSGMDGKVWMALFVV